MPVALPVAEREVARKTHVRLRVRGVVQGVGFRPFIYRLAGELELCGWVHNSPAGVDLAVEGTPARVEEFLRRMARERPAHSSIQSLETVHLDPVGYEGFEIRASQATGEREVLILPDIAPCEECLREISDRRNRRFDYPFTNCTHCGPRFSIMETLPYDRANTSMKDFLMCERCQQEYEDPRNRRFHAQPNACPACGPHVELQDRSGRILLAHGQALDAAARALGEGAVVALKGVGGFQLLVEARSEAAVLRLRERKRREEKPLAVMFPSLAAVRRRCEVGPLEERLLLAPEAPIVLLCRRGRAGEGLAAAVAPGNPLVGAMLPSSPLHHLLLARCGHPVVCTSGNLSDEPMATDNQEALQRLGGVADLFLTHNRPIVRHVDDSVVRMILGREMILRRARGYAPLPVGTESAGGPALAVGGHQKNSVAVRAGRRIFLSQHIGDLESGPAWEVFQRVIGDLRGLYQVEPQRVAVDLHPDYLSRHYAERSGLPMVEVQHHHAHILACMAENCVEPPVLGVAWDGTGLGSDGSLWGGEFLRMTGPGFERAAHLRPFPLPGGEACMREPRRVALGLLYAAWGEAVFEREDFPVVKSFRPEEQRVLRAMLRRGLNCPMSSSIGRLFDGVAALIGLRARAAFEGQAAMELEFALEGMEGRDFYPLPVGAGGTGVWVMDWEPLLRALGEDLRRRVARPVLALRFHNALVEGLVAVASRVGQERVVLSGGCFQNRYLTEQAARRLEENGFRPYWHQRVPPNDGGLALGQLMALTGVEKG